MVDKPSPAAVEAEEALLGACLLSREAIGVAAERLVHQDFWVPANAAIFANILRLHHQGQAVDPVTLADAMDPTVATKARLIELQVGTPASANAGHYSRLVAEKAWLRRVIGFSYELEEAGYGGDVEDVARLLARVENRLERPLSPVDPATDVLDLLERTYIERWLVTDLFERGDRLIVTGGEGRGKSTLLRQLALALAMGVHPFNHHGVPPVRVLHVDLENSEPQVVRDGYQRMAKRVGRPKPGMLWVKNRRQGIDLRGKADQSWLEALVRHHQPELLVIGPLYKMFSSSAGATKHSEEAAEEVARVLDTLIVRYDLTIVIEAHSPHGDAGNRADWRPYGASLWMRWPEFGIGLRAATDVQIELHHWRGARSRGREWPSVLIQSTNGGWPWRTTAGEETLL